MWILKGVVISSVFFLVASLIYLWLALRPLLHASRAIGLSAITGLTIRFPLYWAAFVVTLAAGCYLGRALWKG
ncbi:MAG: hypothetical protein ACRD4Y_09885 [Candidatus Acidiferrales bacterium]